MWVMEVRIELVGFFGIGMRIVGIELAAVDFYFAGQQIVHHRRHKRSAQQIAGEHGENDRHRQRSKQIFGGAADEQDRDEDDADAKRRDERRDGDLRCAVENGLHQPFFLAEIAVDVFNLDRCVIHQNSDRQRHAAEGHDVQRFAQASSGR